MIILHNSTNKIITPINKFVLCSKPLSFNVFKRFMKRFAKRTTRTAYIFLHGRIVDSYLEYKHQVTYPTYQTLMWKLFNFHRNVMSFYNSSESNSYEHHCLVLIRYFNDNIPLDVIKSLKEKRDDDGHDDSGAYLEERNKFYKEHFTQILRKINKKPLMTSDLDYDRMFILEGYNVINDLCKSFYKDSKEMEVYLIYRYYTNFFSALNLFNILYFNIYFNKYLHLVYELKYKKSDYLIYYFINKHFHYINENEILRIDFFKNFENLKNYAYSNSYLLSCNNKERLYKFIIYFNTYYIIIKKKGDLFNYDHQFISEEDNKLLSMYQDLEADKYTKVFFNKKPLINIDEL